MSNERETFRMTYMSAGGSTSYFIEENQINGREYVHSADREPGYAEDEHLPGGSEWNRGRVCGRRESAEKSSSMMTGDLQKGRG